MCVIGRVTLYRVCMFPFSFIMWSSQHSKNYVLVDLTIVWSTVDMVGFNG